MSGTVLSVTSEAVPMIKTGGLADVAGALPAALAGQGWAMRTLMPAYPGLAARLSHRREVWSSSDLFGGPGRVVAGHAAGLDLLLLEAPHLYDRPGGPYSHEGRDHPDNPQRFAALCWAGSEIARAGTSEGWRPQVVHAHDWQGALAPAYMRYDRVGVPSVLTIHNIAFQGVAPAHLAEELRLPGDGFQSHGFEYWGNISVLKAGLVTADALTTVSPTYAEELMRPEFGMGLEGVMRERQGALVGILNGVDTAIWDPALAGGIRAYSGRDLKGKAANREALLAEFGLDPIEGPLAIVVSRLTDQKGIDLLFEALPALLEAGGGLVLLGSGDPALEAQALAAAAAAPGRIGVRIGYDEALAHRMFAGGDAVLVPSRFEPCGLTQMYGLRYGTIPVVAATGGLNDTVIGLSPAAQEVATGFVFHPIDALSLSQALRRMAAAHGDRRLWTSLVRRAMKSEVGWARAAAQYAALYRRLLG